MPSAVEDGQREVPQALWALVHELLVSSGFDKAAKALRKKVDVENGTDGKEDLIAIFNKYASDHDDKKRKKSSAVDENESAKKQKVAGDSKKKNKKAKKESSDEESEEEDSTNARKSKTVKKVESDSEEEDVSTQKKNGSSSKKTDNSESDKVKESASKSFASPKVAHVSDVASTTSSDKRNSNSSPFQRVKAEEVTYLKVKGGKVEEDRLKDNTFESKGGDVFGAKASEILVAVRGKDFRHEKTKKKRSFRSSGPIDMNSNSIKFESDGDE